MSICPNPTEQDVFNLSKLAEQQKNQRTVEIKKKIKNELVIEFGRWIWAHKWEIDRAKWKNLKNQEKF